MGNQVTLQLDIDISLAKFVLAFYSAVTWTFDYGGEFQDCLIHDDLAAGLMLLRDNLGSAELFDNLEWDREEREFIEKFIMNKFDGFDEFRWQRVENIKHKLFIAFCNHTSGDRGLAMKVSRALASHGDVLSVDDLISRVRRGGLQSLAMIRNIGEKSLSLIEELVGSLEAETKG